MQDDRRNDQASRPDEADLARLIEQLRSLHESEHAAVELVARGRRAIPALREVVFERDPSGLFQARCLAVAALAALGAHDALVEFLTVSPRAITDPVERAGEEAVMNAAARALAGSRDEAIYELLLRLAAQPSLAGVIEALGAFRRPETIPYFIEALGDDLGRPAAEAALRKLGRLAVPALVDAATASPEAGDYERASSLRRRRSALALLLEDEGAERLWKELRHLIHDQDATIAFAACRLGLAAARCGEKEKIVERLMELLRSAGWLLGAEIEDCMVARFDAVEACLARALEDDQVAADGQPSQRRRALLRIAARARRGAQATSR
jgi:hypothetical protein